MDPHRLHGQETPRQQLDNLIPGMLAGTGHVPPGRGDAIGRWAFAEFTAVFEMAAAFNHLIIRHVEAKAA
jgi:hypothetical protein